MPPTTLRDPHGRHIHKLRLSLLDACNFRCIYCMPQNPKFMPTRQLTSRQELFHITGTLVNFGVDEVRITGGEPSLRGDFMEIMEDLSELPLKKLGLTSNGLHLNKCLPRLRETSCRHINFSLDSLNPSMFEKMTKSKDLEAVLDSIFMAKELGFSIKVNAVLMKGLNDGEIANFVQFSGKYGIEVRFLELMRIGVARDNFEQHFVSADEIIRELESISDLTSVELPVDSTSFNYRLDNGAEIGIIASETRPFCGGCSRLRLSADGILRPCLMVNTGHSLRNKGSEEISQLLSKTMGLKPIDRIYDVSQPMNQIGG